MNSFLAIHHLRAHKKNEKNSENVGKTMIFSSSSDSGRFKGTITLKKS